MVAPKAQGMRVVRNAMDFMAAEYTIALSEWRLSNTYCYSDHGEPYLALYPWILQTIRTGHSIRGKSLYMAAKVSREAEALYRRRNYLGRAPR